MQFKNSVTRIKRMYTYVPLLSKLSLRLMQMVGVSTHSVCMLTSILVQDIAVGRELQMVPYVLQTPSEDPGQGPANFI